MARRKDYKFTNKKHSIPGIISTLIGFIGIVVIIAAIYISFTHHGAAGQIIGVMGFIDIFLAMIGFVIALVSFRNDDVYYLFSWIGTGLNVFVWIFLMSMSMIGW